MSFRKQPRQFELAPKLPRLGQATPADGDMEHEPGSAGRSLANSKPVGVPGKKQSQPRVSSTTGEAKATLTSKPPKSDESYRIETELCVLSEFMDSTGKSGRERGDGATDDFETSDIINDQINQMRIDDSATTGREGLSCDGTGDTRSGQGAHTRSVQQQQEGKHRRVEIRKAGLSQGQNRSSLTSCGRESVVEINSGHNEVRFHGTFHDSKSQFMAHLSDGFQKQVQQLCAHGDRSQSGISKATLSGPEKMHSFSAHDQPKRESEAQTVGISTGQSGHVSGNETYEFIMVRDETSHSSSSNKESAVEQGGHHPLDYPAEFSQNRETVFRSPEFKDKCTQVTGTSLGVGSEHSLDSVEYFRLKYPANSGNKQESRIKLDTQSRQTASEIPQRETPASKVNSRVHRKLSQQVKTLGHLHKQSVPNTGFSDALTAPNPLRGLLDANTFRICQKYARTRKDAETIVTSQQPAYQSTPAERNHGRPDGLFKKSKPSPSQSRLPDDQNCSSQRTATVNSRLLGRLQTEVLDCYHIHSRANAELREPLRQCFVNLESAFSRLQNPHAKQNRALGNSLCEPNALERTISTPNLVSKAFDDNADKRSDTDVPAPVTTQAKQFEYDYRGRTHESTPKKLQTMWKAPGRPDSFLAGDSATPKLSRKTSGTRQVDFLSEFKENLRAVKQAGSGRPRWDSRGAQSKLDFEYSFNSDVRDKYQLGESSHGGSGYSRTKCKSAKQQVLRKKLQNLKALRRV